MIVIAKRRKIYGKSKRTGEEILSFYTGIWIDTIDCTASQCICLQKSKCHTDAGTELSDALSYEWNAIIKDNELTVSIADADAGIAELTKVSLLQGYM